MTPLERIAAIEERVAKATRGPWLVGECFYGAEGVIKNEIEHICSTSDGEYVETVAEHKENAELIAHARSDIPFLLEQLKLAHQRIKELEDGK